MAPGDTKGCPTFQKDIQIGTPKMEALDSRIDEIVEMFVRIWLLSAHTVITVFDGFLARVLCHTLEHSLGIWEVYRRVFGPKFEEGTKHTNAIRIDSNTWPASQPPQKRRGQPDPIILKKFMR